jgi:hypothetical protein
MRWKAKAKSPRLKRNKKIYKTKRIEKFYHESRACLRDGIAQPKAYYPSIEHNSTQNI